MLSETSVAVQDYLKALYLESMDGERRFIATNAVAHRLEVSAASATNMLKKLATMGYVNHVPYRGAELTDSGRRVALEVVRHHRLLETYLAEALDVPWDQVHDEAEVLEHVLSEQLEQRISERLGHPRVDPHGHPIPSAELAVSETSDVLLWDVPEGQRVTVGSVSDSIPDALRYLGSIGIRPGARLLVVARGPIGGPLFVEVEGGGSPAALSREVAEAIWVVV
jgi:DtxR family transcriptional regulator, Mn-dependent transcriptional regulator